MVALGRLLLESGVILSEEGPLGGISGEGDAQNEVPIRTRIELGLELGLGLALWLESGLGLGLALWLESGLGLWSAYRTSFRVKVAVRVRVRVR
jgi:hypothetical protein